MKKLLFLFFLFSILNTSAQTFSSYDFENLTSGTANNQDNWVIYSSFSNINNGNICPPLQGTEVFPEISNSIDVGSYTNEKSLNFNGANEDQFATGSRKNNDEWSLPNLENQKYLFFDFVLGNGFENKEIRLAYDKNNDTDYALDCSIPDDDELGIGISTLTDGFGNYILNLFSHGNQPLVTVNLPTQNVSQFRLIIDFQENNNQGSISVFYKEFGLSENWQIINFLQNINANFDFNGDNSNNPLNLDGLFIRQGKGINAFFDNIQLQTISKDNNFDVCLGDSISIGYYLDGIDFLWNDNSTNSNNFLSQDQTHTVELNFNNFILINDTFNLNFIDLGNSDLGQDFSICPNDSQLITLDNILNVSYNWHDNSNSNSFLVQDTGLVSVEVNHLGCVSYDTLIVSYSIVPTLDLGNDTTICEFEINLVLTHETNGTSFNWQDGSNTELYTVTEEGLYTLDVYLGECSSSDSIYIRTKKEIKLGNDTTICENQPLFLIVDSIYDDYSWFDGFKESIKIANYKSSQWLNVTLDGCKMYSDTINISVDLLPRLKLAFEDTLVCNDKEIELSVSGTDYESVR